jgi:hypothetical protein
MIINSFMNLREGSYRINTKYMLLQNQDGPILYFKVLNILIF